MLTGRRSSGPAERALAGDLEGLGARVELVSVDLSDSEAMAALLSQVAGLKGVVHAAGVVRWREMARTTAADIEEVLAAKVAGTWNLHRLAGGLELFIACSSIASVWGSAASPPTRRPTTSRTSSPITVRPEGGRG